MKIILGAEAYQSACDLFRYAWNELQAAVDSLSGFDYGTEFESISVIPIIMPSEFHDSYRERKLIKRKAKEADIRLYVDYESFVRCRSDMEREPFKSRRRLLLIKAIVDSITVVENGKKGDFQGIKLIDDLLRALKVEKEDLQNLFRD